MTMKGKIYLGISVGLLAVMAIPLVMTEVNASGSIIAPNYTGQDIEQQAVEHINQAQAALQNGDIEGANNHLELAKQSLQGNQSNQDQFHFGPNPGDG